MKIEEELGNRLSSPGTDAVYSAAPFLRFLPLPMSLIFHEVKSVHQRILDTLETLSVQCICLIYKPSPKSQNNIKTTILLYFFCKVCFRKYIFKSKNLENYKKKVQKFKNVYLRNKHELKFTGIWTSLMTNQPSSYHGKHFNIAVSNLYLRLRIIVFFYVYINTTVKRKTHAVIILTSYKKWTQERTCLLLCRLIYRNIFLSVNISGWTFSTVQRQYF